MLTVPGQDTHRLIAMRAGFLDQMEGARADLTHCLDKIVAVAGGIRFNPAGQRLGPFAHSLAAEALQDVFGRFLSRLAAAVGPGLASIHQAQQSQGDGAQAPNGSSGHSLPPPYLRAASQAASTRSVGSHESSDGGGTKRTWLRQQMVWAALNAKATSNTI